MKTSVKQQAIKFAEENPAQEVCGLFYTNFKTFYFYPCENKSKNPENTFEISTDDFLKAENLGTIYGIFHSHPNENSDFSQNDLDCAEEAGLPIFCYSLQDKKIQEFRPRDYKAQILQKEFICGVSDCFSLVRDYYWNNFNYLIDDFDREEEFEKSNSPLILENYEKQGFFFPENQIDIKEHDVLLYKSIRSVYPHHFEIFVGNSKTIQHLKNRLSGKSMISEEFFGGRYKILRFKDSSLKRNISFA